MLNESPILSVNNLSVNFKILDGIVKAVNNVSFSVERGEVLGIVGESGCGKSQTVLACMGLLANNAIYTGSIKFLGEELLGLNLKKLNKIRGKKIAIIFQDPMTSLNPYLKIKSQMIEVLQVHEGKNGEEATQEAIRMLDFVGISDAKNRINLYPHEFSGGMKQRVMIAMALLCKPELLIADEPTTALDVTIQAQILKILKDLQKEFNMSMVLITHDMGVVANICDRVNIMYAGEVIEGGNINDVFYNPKSPYTQALLRAIPRLDIEVERLATIKGEPPNLMNMPDGCVFQARCEKVHKECYFGDIILQQLSNNHLVKCNLPMK
ncbi:MAG TPA: ABC transporter ATP-binding protein [Burkholderiales bacterium]|nr:ABC transporter ATP-binding protein [Burkholderiales bacterium]